MKRLLINPKGLKSLVSENFENIKENVKNKINTTELKDTITGIEIKDKNMLKGATALVLIGGLLIPITAPTTSVAYGNVQATNADLILPTPSVATYSQEETDGNVNHLMHWLGLDGENYALNEADFNDDANFDNNILGEATEAYEQQLIDALLSGPAPTYVPDPNRAQVTEDAPQESFENLPEDLPETNVGRTVSNVGITLLKQLEGLSLTGYLLGDGMCTIGYGHAVPLSQISAADCRAWSITEEQATEMLIEDIQYYADAVGEHFTRPLTQNQFDALSLFIYNVGPGILSRYNWSSEPADESITGAMMLYTFPAQFRAGLTARRNMEIALFNAEPVVNES